jgi:alpha-tubulin suppressor-like RCC1 family protein
VSTATRITLPALHTIDRIVCGATHCMALLRDQRNHGHVYVWGSHGDGKLGLEVTEDVFVPTRLPIDHSMRDVVCGGDHSFVITEENQVFAWGFLQHAVAFGLERCTQATPRHVPALDGVHQIAAGLDVSFAMFK